MTCPHSQKPCINKHLCEWCRVPNHYGFYMETDKRGKVGWKQRFILESDRRAILRHYDIQIIQAQTLRAAVEKLPSKEEYERKSR